MQDSFFFPLTCTVRRLLDVPNETGIPRYVEVYSGRCDVQWSTNGSTNLAGGLIYQSNPPIFVDAANINFHTNDIIRVIWASGREMEGEIENYESDTDSEIGGTWLWITNFRDVEK